MVARHGTLALACGMAWLSLACGDSAESSCPGNGVYPPAPSLNGFLTECAGAICVHYRPELTVTQATVEALERQRLDLRETLAPVYWPGDDARFDSFLYSSGPDKERAFPCRGQRATVVSLVDRHEAHHVLLSAHEMVHMYTFQEPDRAWSQLFNEGAAVYWGDDLAAQTPDLPPSDLNDYMPPERYLNSLPSGQMMSLAEVHAWEPNRELDRESRLLRYATAGSFVHYLAEARGLDTLLAYLSGPGLAIESPREPRLMDELGRAYGSDLDSLEADWRAWVVTR
ncbi:MAG TPA: hypothetical protein VNN80_24425 [Polyangiaceae bacterium]|nr:hypothetical protein [Polyangiaceae bacterium]